MNLRYAIVAAVLACGPLSGCLGGGDTTTIVQGTTTISTGKQLEDLQRALDEGAITKSEYDKLRKIVLSSSK
jgi:hypothetical protein